MLHTIAFILFAAAALGGAYMTFRIATHAPVPASLGKGHGLAALAALAILFLANLLGREATPAAAWWAFIVLLSGFLGGLLVIAQVYQHRPPLWFVGLHGALAVLGLVLLFGVAF